MASHLPYPTHTKRLAVTPTITYAYIHIPASSSNVPTLLFLHGFPSSSYDWRYQIDFLSQKGYGVLVPDLLGYGDTSKPVEKEEYAYEKMCGHLARVLDEEGLRQVVGVGHDWGSGLLARFANYQQKYLAAAVFIAVPYFAPHEFNLDNMNKFSELIFGYACYGYQLFFNEESAAKEIEKNHDSFISLIYAADPLLWKTDMGPIGKAKEYITSGRKGPKPTWISEEELDAHSSVMLRGGYTGPLNWYKAASANVDRPNLPKIPEEHLTLKFSVLIIAAKEDYITRPEMALKAAEEGKEQGYLPDVEVKQFETGHWVQLEKPRELCETIAEFVERKMGKVSPNM